jgi:hypothetical protein
VSCWDIWGTAVDTPQIAAKTNSTYNIRQIVTIVLYKNLC